MTREKLLETLLQVQARTQNLVTEIADSIIATIDKEPNPDTILTHLMQAATKSHEIYVELDNTYRKARKEEEQNRTAEEYRLNNPDNVLCRK